MASLENLLRIIMLMLAISKGGMSHETEGKCGQDIYQSMTKSLVSLNELVTTLTDHVANLKMSMAEMKVKVDRITEENSELTTSSKIVHWQIKDNAERQNDLKNSLNSTRTELEDTKTVIANLESKVEKTSTRTELENTKTVIANLQKKVDNGIANVENSVVKTNSRIDMIPQEVTVVSGEEKDGYEKCLKVCAGTSTRSMSKWITNRVGWIYMDVDIKHCGFTRIPIITTSIEGSTDHWTARGTSSIYGLKSTSFRLHLNYGGITAERAKSYKWNIEWIAVGPTCHK